MSPFLRPKPEKKQGDCATLYEFTSFETDMVIKRRP
jgi:hypothetical protein